MTLSRLQTYLFSDAKRVAGLLARANIVVEQTGDEQQSFAVAIWETPKATNKFPTCLATEFELANCRWPTKTQTRKYGKTAAPLRNHCSKFVPVRGLYYQSVFHQQVVSRKNFATTVDLLNSKIVQRVYHALKMLGMSVRPRANKKNNNVTPPVLSSNPKTTSPSAQ